jgi:hypothetical protein
MRLREVLITALPPFVIGVVATSACLVAAGTSLGLYFGGMVIAALTIPALSVRHERVLEASIAAGGAIDGVGIVWLVAVLFSATTLGQWLPAFFLLVASGLACFALVMFLRAIFGSTASSAIVVIVAFAWLSVPIWLRATAAAHLSVIHPLMALNRVFIEQGVWTQQRLMYQLTSLGQDVPYSLPASIFPCVFAHAFMAVSLGWPAWWMARRGESAARPPEASSAV